MLSNKVKEYCQQKGWWHESVPEEYKTALQSINVDLASDFAEFYLHAEDLHTFLSRKREIYQVCWFILNSHYQQSVTSAHESLKLPEAYIPLSTFDEDGFFYNRSTGEVLHLEVGEKLVRLFETGQVTPDWPDFNSFLEWYFER